MKLVEERVKHWLGVGAQPTDRVLRFLDAAGMRKRDARSNPNKGQPGKKRIEREEAKAPPPPRRPRPPPKLPPHRRPRRASSEPEQPAAE